VKALVIDGSTALGFLLKDEKDSNALNALAAIERGVPTFIPAHCQIEAANGLLMAERRKRVTQSDVAEALGLLGALPLVTDPETAARAGSDTIALARQYGLTIYDAAYLELAMRRGASLATRDLELARSAKSAGVELLAILPETKHSAGPK
jgi:predicted nucleic acid-binding protein